MPAAPQMQHTFLFQPARWEAEGTYTDGLGDILPAQGFSLVLHAGSHWFIEGRMRVLGSVPTETFSHCSVVPFPTNSSCTTWSSKNNALGRLSGRFVIVGDTLFSFFGSEDGHHNGSEWLRQIDAGTYENRGVLFRGDRLITAWAVTLARKE